MKRILLSCVLAGASAFCQTGAQPGAGAPRSPQPMPTPFEQLPPDAVVITIHGLCSGDDGPIKGDACTTTITRAQFDQIVAEFTLNTQPLNPAARRGFAEGYVQLLTLAAAGRSVGVDKEPGFQDLLKMARTRVLADAYRRSLDNKFNHPAPQEIETYYQQNITRFERLQLERMFIPRANPQKPNQNPSEFEKKARQLATSMHERAAKGEDMGKLEAEAYSTLNLTSPPPVSMGTNPRASLQPPVNQEVTATKPGGVTSVISDATGFTFYKVRSRDVLPLDAVKSQIEREIAQKNREAAVKSAMGSIRPDYNQQFFSLLHPAPAGAPPLTKPGTPAPRH